MMEDVLNICWILNLELNIPIDAAIGHVINHEAEGRGIELLAAVNLKGYQVVFSVAYKV